MKLLSLSLIFLIFVSLSQEIKLKIVTPDDIKLSEQIITEDFVNKINSLQSKWIASSEQGSLSKITRSEARVLTGALKGGPILPKKIFSEQNMVALPTTFDSRTQWPQCDTIKAIRDQSACGSCWAFGAVESMSDRYCITLKKLNLSISAQDLNSCCDECGAGCGGGFPSSAWQYWAEKGLVSEKCSPYSLPGCDHHIPNSKNPCPSKEYPTPPCVKSCTDSKNWKQDLHFGSSVYSVSGEQAIMQEVYQHGPAETTFIVYEDFLTYKSGVYQHVSGPELGGHAVKVVGWGVDKNQKYWLMANSWNANWGDKGFFKILKGVNECGIEE